MEIYVLLKTQWKYMCCFCNKSRTMVHFDSSSPSSSPSKVSDMRQDPILILVKFRLLEVQTFFLQGRQKLMVRSLHLSKGQTARDIQKERDSRHTCFPQTHQVAVGKPVRGIARVSMIAIHLFPNGVIVIVKGLWNEKIAFNVPPWLYQFENKMLNFPKKNKKG